MLRRFRSLGMKGKFLPFFLKNWWVVSFISIAFAFYVRALYQKNQLIFCLEEKAFHLEKEKSRAISENEQLILKLKSEDDPEWVELVLRQKLGVAGEGETKVIFPKRCL